MNRTPARTSWSPFALVAIGAVGLVACSSQGAGTNVGDSAVPADSGLVVWRSAGGGFGPQIPAGASCHFETDYSLNLHGGELTWSLCKLTGTDFSDPSAYNTVAGSRVLTASELGQASAAAHAVTVSGATTCGADLDSRSLEVDRPSGSITYGDDFYACEKQYEHYVFSDQLNNLRIVLDGMAHNL